MRTANLAAKLPASLVSEPKPILLSNLTGLVSDEYQN